MVVPAIWTLGQPIKSRVRMPTRQITLLEMAMSEADLGSTLNFLTRKPPPTMPSTAPGMATPPVNMFASELLVENWCSMYLGRNVMKPEMMVISKQYANVTIMNTRLSRRFFIALGST